MPAFNAAADTGAGTPMTSPADAFSGPRKPAGTSGHALPGGRSDYEKRADLVDIGRRMLAYRKARRSHAVQAGMALRKSTQTSADFSVIPGVSGSLMATKAAEFIARSLGIKTKSIEGGAPEPRIGRSWVSLLRELLEYEDDGFGWWALLCRDGLAGEMVVDVLWRDPASACRFEHDGAKLLGIWQRPVTGGWGAGFGGEVLCPADQILYLGRQVTGTQFDGIGLLRAVEAIVADSARIQNVQAATVERWGLGVPLVEYDVATAILIVKENSSASKLLDPTFMDEQVAKWHGLAEKYQSGTRIAMAPPPWIKLSEFGGRISGLAEMMGVNDGLDRRALLAYGAQWLVLGDSSGSHALGDALKDSSETVAEADLRDTLAQFRSGYIAKACRWQFGPDLRPDDIPSIEATGIVELVWKTKLAELIQLFQADAIPRSRHLAKKLMIGLNLDADIPADWEPGPASGAVKAAQGSGPASGTAPGNAG